MIYAATEIYIAAICQPPQASRGKKQTHTFHEAVVTLKCNVFDDDRSDDGSIQGSSSLRGECSFRFDLKLAEMDCESFYIMNS